jgi:serine/threonine protein kinase
LLVCSDLLLFCNQGVNNQKLRSALVARNVPVLDAAELQLRHIIGSGFFSQVESPFVIVDCSVSELLRSFCFAFFFVFCLPYMSIVLDCLLFSFCVFVLLFYFHLMEQVRLAEWHGVLVACKSISEQPNRLKNQLEIFLQEVGIMAKLRHPNVVQFLGVSLQARPLL